MKQIIILFFLLGAGSFLRAQDIDFVEYFWDEDPGVGMGVGIPVAPADLVDIDLAVNPAGLTAGIHYLGVRTRNTNGSWSVPSYTKFVVHELIAAEYFWDEDPGLGNGNAVALNSNDQLVNETIAIDTDGLTQGNHLLGVRTKSLGGTWSHTFWKTMRIDAPFLEGEYFWDVDPGIGNAQGFSLPNDITNLDTDVEISTEGLKPGWHNLYSRIRNVNGSFGHTIKKRLYVERSVVGGEYFWDTDPGVGNGIQLATLSEGANAQVCDEASTVGLDEGVHYLYVRTVSDDNVWSIPSRIQITVTPNEFLIGCPGDFDRNGTVAAGDLLAFLGGFGTTGDCTVDLNGDFVVDTSDLLIFLSLFGSDCE